MSDNRRCESTNLTVLFGRWTSEKEGARFSAIRSTLVCVEVTAKRDSAATCCSPHCPVHGIVNGPAIFHAELPATEVFCPIAIPVHPLIAAVALAARRIAAQWTTQLTVDTCAKAKIINIEMARRRNIAFRLSRFALSIKDDDDRGRRSIV